MGTEVERRGVATTGEGWSANALDLAPDVVTAIHADYTHAGATIHRTNTFRTQPRIFPDRYRSLVGHAVSLAREGSVNRRVAGSIAPIFDCYRPDLSPSDDIARPLHRAMVQALADEKVDLLICETFPSANEACVAVEEAVKTGIETWVALTAGPKGDLMTPEAMHAAARDCIYAGASAVLVCCTDARRTQPYVDRLAKMDVPFGAYANAFGDHAISRESYADLAEGWQKSGATIIGSCCGTRPEHIAELARRFARFELIN
jgi:S-methylmethionine-dependent homocysteine/selenocysteine methylase